GGGAGGRPCGWFSWVKICWNIGGPWPEEASPPVSDTPKPILIGSCACAEKTAPDNITAAAASSDNRGRAFSAILILHPFIVSSPVHRTSQCTVRSRRTILAIW